MFTKSTDDLNIIQKLADAPNIEDGMSAEQLKAKFDEAGNKLQDSFNGLVDELENITASTTLGADKLDEEDDTGGNVQSKLNKLQQEYTALKEGGIDNSTITTEKIVDGNVTTSKIQDANITTSKIADSNVTTSKIADGNVTTSKVADGAITLDKLAGESKTASNIVTTSIGSGDTSANNVQAKLNYLQNEIVGVSQGSVADGSITTAKVLDNAITTSKILDANITANKIADTCIGNEKIVGGFALIPSGLICMWSGETVPTGWHLCDGQNGTPDLRDRFIVGSGSTYSTGNMGGADRVVLTEAEMPAHNHSKSWATGGHGSYGSNVSTVMAGSEPVRCTSYDFGKYVDGSTTFTTNNTGSGQSHENRPPYYALAFIMKA